MVLLLLGERLFNGRRPSQRLRLPLSYPQVLLGMALSLSMGSPVQLRRTLSARANQIWVNPARVRLARMSLVRVKLCSGKCPSLG